MPVPDGVFGLVERLKGVVIGVRSKLKDVTELFSADAEVVEVGWGEFRPEAQLGYEALSGCVLAGRRGVLDLVLNETGTAFEAPSRLAAVALHQAAEFAGTLEAHPGEVFDKLDEGGAVGVLGQGEGIANEDVHVANPSGGLTQGGDGFDKTAELPAVLDRGGGDDGLEAAGLGAQGVNFLGEGCECGPGQQFSQLAEWPFDLVLVELHDSPSSQDSSKREGQPNPGVVVLNAVIPVGLDLAQFRDGFARRAGATRFGGRSGAKAGRDRASAGYSLSGRGRASRNAANGDEGSAWAR